jgi:Holliday junction resolvasome RuvABC DNA-binding subunit
MKGKIRIVMKKEEDMTPEEKARAENAPALSQEEALKALGMTMDELQASVAGGKKNEKPKGIFKRLENFLMK